jgi:hypothetical protein
MATSSPAPTRQRSVFWLQGLLCGAVLTVATPTALLVGVLLGPGLVALLLDRQPGRPRARSIVLCGTAACVAPLQALWSAGHTLDTAMALLTHLDTIALAWSAAAIGWLLAEMAPIGARAVLEALSRTRAARLRALRARLVEEWGLQAPDDQ